VGTENFLIEIIAKISNTETTEGKTTIMHNPEHPTMPSQGFLRHFFGLIFDIVKMGARCNVDGSGDKLQDGRTKVQVLTRSLTCFNLPNPPSRTMALEFTQPRAEMISRRY
jgi:hypothetical protein